MIELKFLVIGLGSMGKRRIRNLVALGYADYICGFDQRDDRRVEANEKYNIPTFSSLEDALNTFKPTVWIISTPPDWHMHYAFKALAYKVPAFIEASVTDADKILELSTLSLQENVLILPSCTTLFSPGQKKVRELLSAQVIGSVLSCQYHTGQYLPDWHPWETIDEYYVSKRDTGGGREIVPFELTWMNALWGHPDVVSCIRGKLSSFKAEIDDFYHVVLRYPHGELCTLTIDVIARPKCVRELRVIGSDGILEWSHERNDVRYCTTAHPEWVSHSLEVGVIEPMYINSELPYIQELKAFIDAISHKDRNRFPNTLKKDFEVLSVLLTMEEKS